MLVEALEAVILKYMQSICYVGSGLTPQEEPAMLAVTHRIQAGKGGTNDGSGVKDNGCEMVVMENPVWRASLPAPTSWGTYATEQACQYITCRIFCNSW